MESENLFAESVDVKEIGPVVEHGKSVPAHDSVQFHLSLFLNGRIFLHLEDERQQGAGSLCV